MGKKSRIRQQREKKELEKEVAYRKDLEHQSNSEKGNLKRAFLETDCECPDNLDYEQIGNEALLRRETKYGWEETKTQERRNLYAGVRGRLTPKRR